MKRSKGEEKRERREDSTRERKRGVNRHRELKRKVNRHQKAFIFVNNSLQRPVTEDDDEYADDYAGEADRRTDEDAKFLAAEAAIR